MIGVTERSKDVLCVQTLLDLGASPDYKDSRGLTPLYHSSMVGGDPYCCELLLHDHAQVGCMDENGWQEIHQVTHVLTCSCSQRLMNQMPNLYCKGGIDALLKGHLHKLCSEVAKMHLHSNCNCML